MNKDAEKIINMIEAVSTDVRFSETDVDKLIADAKKYHYCRIVGPMCYIEKMSRELEGTGVGFSAPIATPSGVGETTESKIQGSKYIIEHSKITVDIDMVINLVYINSGRFDLAQQDIEAVRKAFPDHCLKVVIEAPMLDDEKLRGACLAVKNAGADYIKTSTGATGTTTVELVKKIRDIAGYDIGIKAAGGIRTLETVEAMIALGVDRFGMNYKTAHDFSEMLMNM